MKPLALIILAASLTQPVLAATAACKLQTLKPAGSKAQAGSRMLDLGEADDANKPTAWQGPIVSGQCSVDLSIISTPLILAADRYLYVPSYSGSSGTISIIDLQDCGVIWSRPDDSGKWSVNTKRVVVEGKSQIVDSSCLPKDIKPVAKPQ